MEKIAFFDAKPYDRTYFDKLNDRYEIQYFESRLRPEAVRLAEGCRAVCAFVNDDLGERTINSLAEMGVGLVAMRCAGYNNVSLSAAQGKLRVVRVPAYSPYAVAEHAMGMILMLNRKLHKAYIRTRDFNFSLNGNDDAIRAVKLIVAKMADAVIEANQGEAQADFAEAFEAEETTEA